MLCFEIRRYIRVKADSSLADKSEGYAGIVLYFEAGFCNLASNGLSIDQKIDFGVWN